MFPIVKTNRKLEPHCRYDPQWPWNKIIIDVIKGWFTCRIKCALLGTDIVTCRLIWDRRSTFIWLCFIWRPTKQSFKFYLKKCWSDDYCSCGNKQSFYYCFCSRLCKIGGVRSVILWHIFFFFKRFTCDQTWMVLSCGQSCACYLLDL